MLNQDQPHTPCPEVVLRIKQLAREAGSTATVDYEAQQLGFQVTWVDPKDQAEQLRREVRDLLTDVSRKLDLVERAEQRGNFARVVK
jgi:hypothetical protein